MGLALLEEGCLLESSAQFEQDGGNISMTGTCQFSPSL